MLEMVHILAFAGKRKSGKSEACRIAVKLLDRELYYFPFAKPLKDTYAKEMGIPREYLDDPVKKEFHRIGMQKLSMEIKNGDPNHFIDLWEQEVGALEPGSIVLCDDVRYIREWGRIHKLGGHVYQLWTDQIVKEKYRNFKYDPAVDLDPSETELDGFSAEDFHLAGGGRIYNNYTTVEPLENEIFNILKYRIPPAEQKLVFAMSS
jgi:phosphomevalonate kinase